MRISPVDLANGVSIITPERLENLVRALNLTTHLPGDMAELGVYRGGSAKAMAATTPARRLHLFDTFSGLPYSETPERDPDANSVEGMFACPMEEVKRFLRGAKVSYHPGVFPRSARRLGHLRFSFVHVDCDLYDGARAAIAYFWPRLANGGIMFFDDYNCRFTGVTDAVNEAFESDRIVPQREPSTGVHIGCYVVKQ